MQIIHKQSLILWGIIALIYLAFLNWHGAFETPLTKSEIDNFVKTLVEQNPDRDAAQIYRLLENDDGGPIYVVNAIKYADIPGLIDGKIAGESGQEVLEEYTGFVISYLIKRGSYPIYGGEAIANSIDRWGIDNADAWSSGAIVRYRSRRVLMEMATDPAFSGFHAYKVAGIEKTFAFPTSPVINLANLPLLIFLALMSIGLLIQMILLARQSKASAGGL